MQYYGNAEIIFDDGEHTVRQHREIELEYVNGDSTRFRLFILGPAKGYETAKQIEVAAHGVSWHGRVTDCRFLAANNTTTVEFTATAPEHATAR